MAAECRLVRKYQEQRGDSLHRRSVAGHNTVELRSTGQPRLAVSRWSAAMPHGRALAHISR
jgi:hypothetical protein